MSQQTRPGGPTLFSKYYHFSSVARSHVIGIYTFQVVRHTFATYIFSYFRWLSCRFPTLSAENHWKHSYLSLPCPYPKILQLGRSIIACLLNQNNQCWLAATDSLRLWEYKVHGSLRVQSVWDTYCFWCLWYLLYWVYSCNWRAPSGPVVGLKTSFQEIYKIKLLVNHTQGK